MGKHHSSSPSPAGSAAHSMPTSSPPLASQLSMQLKQDLAMLAHKDPDTRRSSMEALKLFIEGDLDARTMPGFLEQLSGETGKSSGSYAISLFVEVARVHKEATVPFIPRIMAAVLRTLASSSGGAGHTNNFHQACAKVVASVARYAIEPPSRATRSSSATDVLDSLCQPLLGLLSSNVEPVAVGSATCLQAIVEAENWKLAAPELVHDVCLRSSISLVEKGKHSVAHIHLACSLAKFNAGTLQDYASSLLKVGMHVLVGAGGSTLGCGSWQQRAAAAQLLGTLIRCLDHSAVVPDLVSTTKALEKCRLDKIATVRQAVGEALSVAKSMASKIDSFILQDGGSEVHLTSSSPTRSRLPELRKRMGHKKHAARPEESCGSTITANDFVMDSQESQFVSYGSSPSSSITSISTPSVRSPSPPPAVKSTTRTGRAPLFPAKQSAVCPPSSVDKYMAESDLPLILAHMKSSDFKENSPLLTKVEDGLVLTKSDDTSYLLYGSRNKITKESDEFEFTMDGTGDHVHVADFECHQSLAEECVEADTIEADSSSEKDVICKQGGVRHGTTFFDQEEDKNFSECRNSGANNNRVLCGQNQQKAACPQVAKTCMSAEDFLIFSTPRRLVRSLQSVCSTPDSKGSPERDQGLDLDCETLSESGWSVRDNPMAGDNEDDNSPRLASLICGQKNSLTRSMEMESPIFMGLLSEGPATQLHSATVARSSQSAEHVNLPSGSSRSDHVHDFSCNECKGLNKNVCTSGLTNGSASEYSSCPERGGLSGLPEEEQMSRSLKPVKSRDWSRCVSVLRKMQFYAEGFLVCTLVVVLAFTTLVAFLSITRQHDLHRLVPT